ncbi:MAG: hypothetical protein LUC85_09180 [Bacteroidales bacterium]|nr:hypothetical protein [Bacteroidales bacterium]
MTFSGILAACALVAQGEENTLISFTLSTTSSTKITLNGTGTVTVKPQDATSGTTVTLSTNGSMARTITITPSTAGETWVITGDDATVTVFTKRNDTDSGTIPLPDSNPITAIDVTNDPALTSLTLKYQQAITTIDLSKSTELTTLYIEYNKLAEIDLSSCTKLKYVDVSSNLLTSFDVTKNPDLVWLECNDNKLSSLNVSHNTSLSRLEVDSNSLTEIDLSKNTALTALWIRENKFTSIDLTYNTLLSELKVDGNKLTSLDVSMLPELSILDCEDTSITELDLSSNTKLTQLDCNLSPIKGLDLSNNPKLTAIACEFCELEYLDASACSPTYMIVVEGNKLAYHTIKWSENLTGSKYDREYSSTSEKRYPLYFVTCMQQKIRVPYSELYVDLSEYMQPITFREVTYPTKLEGFYVYDSSTLGTVEDYPYGPWYEPSPFGSDSAREGTALGSDFYISLKDYKEANSTDYNATYGSFEQTDLDKKFNISDQIFNVYDTDGDRKISLYAVLSNDLFGSQSDYITELPLTLYTVPMEFSHPTPTGVESVALDEMEIVAVYDLQGRLRDGLQTGVNIVRYNDGSVRKIKK